jgi:hypothetical protein
VNALCYNPGMTFLEVTFELQAALTSAQLTKLGAFAHTYGLRKFHVDETKRLLTFEFDASRLRASQIAHVLGQARIGVLRRVDPLACEEIPAEKK